MGTAAPWAPHTEELRFGQHWGLYPQAKEVPLHQGLVWSPAPPQCVCAGRGRRRGPGEVGRTPDPVSVPKCGPLCHLPSPPLGLTGAQPESTSDCWTPTARGPPWPREGCRRGPGVARAHTDGARLWRLWLEMPRGPRSAALGSPEGHALSRGHQGWPRPRLGSSGFTTWLPSSEAGAGDGQARPPAQRPNDGLLALSGEGCRGGPSGWRWEVPGPSWPPLYGSGGRFHDDPTVRPVSLATWMAIQGSQGHLTRLA